jgi:tRNA-modifying protein YgfZ
LEFIRKMSSDAYWAAQQTVALADRRHWGQIEVSDADRLRFLHNQTTNALQTLQPGQGCDTVFVTSTARTIDLVTAYVGSSSVRLLCSPDMAQPLIDWMDRYIFFADRVKLTNVSEQAGALTVVGPNATECLQQLGLADTIATLVDAPEGQHSTTEIDGLPLSVAVGTGLALPGYTLLFAANVAEPIWQRLLETGIAVLSASDWERLRLEQGRPMPVHELTDDDNPLEAGLWQTISFNKGCYIGQETIARLNTYQGVKKQLWGIRLAADSVDDSATESSITDLEVGTPIWHGQEKVGTLTSWIPTPEGIIGLGYIRTKAGGAGLSIRVNDWVGNVVEIPFASRGYLENTEAKA